MISLLRAILLLVGCCLSIGQSAAQSDVARRLVGTWRLVSIMENGRIDLHRGPHPAGMIYYDAKGYMAVQIMPDRPRPKFAAANPTPDEAKAALSGYTAYFGTYSIDERAHTVTHHRTGDIHPGPLGDFVRRYEFTSNDRLILRPVETDSAVTWERIK
jgi:hypothetical protein